MDTHRVMDEEFLTVKQVAEWLHKSKRTIYRLIEEGELHYYRPTPRGALIAKTDLYAFMQGKKYIIWP